MIYKIHYAIIFRPEDGAIWNVSNDKNVITLTAIPVRIFCHLLNNRGSIIDREELLKRVWDDYGLMASSNALNQHISQIRRVLTELGCEFDVIQTIPKKGFLVAIDAIETESLILPPPEAEVRVRNELPPTVVTGKSFIRLKVYAVLLLIITVWLFTVPLPGAHGLKFPQQKLYLIGRISKCPIYMSSEKSSLSQQAQLRLSAFASQYINCTASENYVLFTDEAFLSENKGRIFLSRCAQGDGNKTMFSGCRGVYLREK